MRGATWNTSSLLIGIHGPNRPVIRMVAAARDLALVIPPARENRPEDDAVLLPNSAATARASAD